MFRKTLLHNQDKSSLTDYSGNHLQNADAEEF